MSEATVRTVLRLVAVVTILVGTILLTSTLVGLVGASRALHDAMTTMGGRMSGAIAQSSLFAVLSQAVIVAEGLMLYVLSPRLAEKLVAP